MTTENEKIIKIKHLSENLKTLPPFYIYRCGGKKNQEDSNELKAFLRIRERLGRLKIKVSENVRFHFQTEKDNLVLKSGKYVSEELKEFVDYNFDFWKALAAHEKVSVEDLQKKMRAGTSRKQEYFVDRDFHESFNVDLIKQNIDSLIVNADDFCARYARGNDRDSGDLYSDSIREDFVDHLIPFGGEDLVFGKITKGSDRLQIAISFTEIRVRFEEGYSSRIDVDRKSVRSDAFKIHTSLISDFGIGHVRKVLRELLDDFLGKAEL